MQLSDTNLERLPLKQFTEKSYLDYAMYVILDRALPFIGDGLKPVQRRIVYAMSELGLSHTAKYKKSARTVGDVIGKFHPHGDSASYEAMVLMAQDFSYRYPLIDGQGNWGSIDDPKSFAAMRYTESKLTKYAETLLSELGMGTVDWQPNFDGTLQEPTRLPARLPNILLNGGSGIAVGMSTDIPPHNLTEVVNACIYLLENKNANIYEVCRLIKAPDFPGGAEIITPQRNIRKIYQTGNGTIKMRATWVREDGQIVIGKLPYQTSGSKVIEQIAKQMRERKLTMVQDLRDESDHENPIRLVIIPRSNRVNCEQLMSHLFATTDLEKTIRINLNMISLNGKPMVKNLLQILTEWLEYRKEVVRRRLEFRLKKVSERLHILEGFLIAYINIDEVIRIVRTEDHPKEVLMSTFKISEMQANAILDLRLRQLAKLEEIKIIREQKILATEKAQLEGLLGSNLKLRNLIKKELIADVEMFGDERRSQLVIRDPAVQIDPQDFIPAESVTIILSEKGWIRSARGHDIDPASLSYKSGDSFLAAVAAKSNQNSVILDSSGRVYTLLNNTLPSARGQGEPLTGKLDLADGNFFCDIASGKEDELMVVASDAGYGFVAKLGAMLSRGKSGKSFVNVPAGSKVLGFDRVVDIESDIIALVSNQGRLLLFAVKELPLLSRGKGNKMMGLKHKNREEFITDFTVLPATGKLKLFAGKRHLTIDNKDLTAFISERGRRGSLLPRGLRNVDKLQVET